MWPFTASSMISPQELVKEAFIRSMKKAFPSIEHDPVVVPSNPKFGDYQCNSAMAIFKEHKDFLQVKTPFAIGEKLKENLDSEAIEKAVVSPQGFITVTLTNNWLSHQLVSFLKPKITCQAKQKLKCLVDYSSPNIAKEMHVGHLRSTIIGEAICRCLEFVGHDVDRVNHLGDWGTQFGMLIEYMREEYPNFQSNPPELSNLTDFYREAKKRFDSNSTFKLSAQKSVVALQSGESAARAAWKLFCDISRKDFNSVYQRLDVRLEEFGESFYNDKIPSVLQELTEKKLLVDSCGAKCIFVEPIEKREKEVPLMAVKSDGGYGYDSTDLAAIRYRLLDLKCQWVLYVTDIGQEQHFMSIFKAAELAGWHDPIGKTTRVDHIGFGVVQGDDGKKFKTRSGKLVKLNDLLDESVERALVEIKNRRVLDESETVAEGLHCDSHKDAVHCGGDEVLPVEVAARKIGYSAVKYFDLKQNRNSNYKFSYEKMLDPRGNTAVYLLYAYARICSIFRKVDVRSDQLNSDNFTISEPEERALILHLLKFPQVMSAILDDVGVHRLAEYMYDTSSLFTNFYQKCRVIGSEEQNSRLIICEMTRKLLQVSFNLLGIQALSRI